VFTTAEDMQPSVEIHVLQGEREMAQFNKTLGKFQLVDLPPAPRGVPQIEVTFDIDANGIVHVSAKDRATSKEQSMTITGQSSLNKDDINQMVRDAEAHADEDRKRKEEAEVRNNADTLVYQTEKLLREQGDKITGDEKDKVEAGLKELKDALGGTDTDAINQMVKDAEAHAEEDRQRREEAEVRNNADSLVYQTEQVRREQGDKMGDAKSNIESNPASLKEALTGSELEAIKSASERLMTASQAFSQKLYEAAARDTAGSAGTSASGASANAPSDDEVVDAEIVDEDS